MEISNRNLYVIIIILSIALILMAAGLYARPVSTDGPREEHTLSVSGSASTDVAPDTAVISIGVLVQAETAAEAANENSETMNTVINELKTTGLEDKDIQTSFLSIQPVYRYPEGGEPTIVGYTASNNVQVTTDMIERVGDIVDRSVAAGANQVSGISFQVSEEKQKQLRDQLLADAVKDASSKATTFAESLDVRIVGVKSSSISEGGLQPPFEVPQAVMVERAVTPVQPGETKVTLSVQLVYIIE